MKIIWVSITHHSVSLFHLPVTPVLLKQRWLVIAILYSTHFTTSLHRHHDGHRCHCVEGTESYQQPSYSTWTIWLQEPYSATWLSRITFKRGHGVCSLFVSFPDSKVFGVNMGPTRGRQDPGGPHVGPMNLAIWCGYKYNTVMSKTRGGGVGLVGGGGGTIKTISWRCHDMDIRVNTTELRCWCEQIVEPNSGVALMWPNFKDWIGVQVICFY